jgi:hypothetical protein
MSGRHADAASVLLAHRSDDDDDDDNDNHMEKERIRGSTPPQRADSRLVLTVGHVHAYTHTHTHTHTHRHTHRHTHIAYQVDGPI